MDPISSGSGTGVEIYAMKKAMEVQGQGIMKVLESAIPSSDLSGSGLTGLDRKTHV